MLKTSHNRCYLARLSFLACACLNLAHAQFDTASVLGTVRDASGSVVKGSTVTLENPLTNVKTTTLTDEAGSFQFSTVRIGTYRVTAQATGFSPSVADNVEVTVNSRRHVDLQLQIGQSTTTVTVTGAVAALETENSSRGQVINPKQIVDLPLNGRAYADLALLVPGVRKSLLNNQSETSRDASFNVNGQRSASNSFMMDGIDNNAYQTANQGFSNQVIQASPDALQEFKVETNNYSAEYGRASGAVINASTRSGTNQLHGALWEFMRNTDLNAVGFFQPVGGVKPVYQQNQFGAAVGGPIRKNKTFLFGDYEALRRVSRSLAFATVPTAAMDAGQLGTAVKNPLTGQLYPDGVVPKSDWSQFAKALLSQLPAPNLPGIANNYESLPRTTIGDNKGDIRLDQYFGQRVVAFVRFSYDDKQVYSPSTIPPPAGGSANGATYISGWQLAPGITWTINPTSVLEVRFGVSNTESGKSPIGLGLPSDIYGIPGLPTDPSITGGLPTVNLNGGLSDLGRQSSNPQFQDPVVLDPKVNFSKTLGRHSLKMGVEYQHIDTSVSDFHPQYGQIGFNGEFSNPGVTSVSNAQHQAYTVADMIFGTPSDLQLNNNVVVDLKQWMAFGYLQDDYRVNQKLTLNLGLRYEFGTPQWERDNHLANFDPVRQQLIQSSAGGIYDRSLLNPNTHDFAPRIGLAYRIGGKTVVRSAYGISYMHFNRMGGENLLSYNGPYIVDETITPLPSQPLCTDNKFSTTCYRPIWMGFPEGIADSANFSTLTAQTRYIPANTRDGSVQSWHFTVQRELPKNFVLDVAYVGNHGVHEIIMADENQASPNPNGQNIPISQRRPFSNFTTIEMSFDGGWSNYNGLQVKLEKHYGSGLYLLNSFTYSKAEDPVSGHLEANDGDQSRLNLYNIAGEKGVSSYDQTFNDTTSIIYELPFGKGRHFRIDNSIANFILGGWQTNLIDTLTSGLPINITYSPTTQSVSSLPNYRPNCLGDPVTPEGQRTTKNYLNAAMVSTPDNQHPWGSCGRNNVRGYPFYELDMGLQKSFPLWSESSALQFRAEAFNLLNHTNFLAPASNLGSTFGTITGTFPARQLQFGLKLRF